MKENVKRPPRSQSLVKAAEHFNQMVEKRLRVNSFNYNTRKCLLQVAEILEKTINDIYTATGTVVKVPMVNKHETKEQLDRIESALIDISKQRIECSNTQKEQSTIKRTITIEKTIEYGKE